MLPKQKNVTKNNVLNRFLPITKSVNLGLPVNEASVTDSADDTLDPPVVDIAPDEVTDVPNAPAQAFCPECGEALSPDAMFCASCGSRIPGID